MTRSLRTRGAGALTAVFLASAALVAVSGAPASASDPVTVSVDAGTVVQNDFLGIGVNVIPGSLMKGTTDLGYTDADWAVDSARIAKLRPKVARIWFQTDWMEPTKGVYTFTSDRMLAFYRYLDAFKAAGTDVELDFGWKVGSTIQSWYSIPGVDPWTSAPNDIPAYARAASALLDQLINQRGYDNVKYLTYYNEPNGSWDFEAPGDQMAYYLDMAKAVSDQLKTDGLRDDVKIWGPEESGAPAWTQYMAANGGDAFDQYSFHTYGDSYSSVAGSIAARTSVAGGKPVDMSEFGWSSDTASGWDSGYANYVIAGANNGLHSMLVWQLNGVWTSDPDGDTNGTYNLWDSVLLGMKPRKTFSAAGLLTRYIPAHSDVLKASSSSGDVRAAAFRGTDGEYTVLVESKAGAGKDLTVDFGALDLGRPVHRIAYTDAVAPDDNALLPASSATIPATTGFSDTLGSDYTVAVYTTAAPAVQVAMDQVTPTVASGSTLQLDAQVIDGAAGVTWSIDGTGAGSVSSTGVYTPPAVASERKVAVIATSTADPTARGVSVVTVTPAPDPAIAAPPTFSLPSGVYDGSRMLTLSTTTTGAQIRYTTDGSTPTATSTLYQHPIVLSESTTRLYRAAAFAPGLTASGSSSRLYKVGAVSDGPDGYTLCADEGGTCYFSGQQSVAFGGDGLFSYQTRTGDTPCTTAELGDPNPSVEQHCYVSPTIPAEYPIVTITNGGFEKPAGTKSKTGPFTNGWTFNTRSGIQNAQGPLGPGTPPEGSQVAYLKTDAGVQGEISQQLNFPSGTFQLAFDLSGRSGYPAQTFDVLYDSTTIGSFTVNSTTSYTAVRSALFASTGGKHTITFRATAPSGDRTAFIDDVRVQLPAAPAVPALANAGFESPATTNVKSAPFSDGWAFTGTAGIQHNGSAFGAATAPEGTQTALLQSKDGSVGSFSQSVDFVPGDYRLTFQAAKRPGYPTLQPIQVLVDGTVVMTATPSATTWTAYSTPTFTVTAGAHTIAFRGSAPSGDATAFVDAVTLDAVPAAGLAVTTTASAWSLCVGHQAYVAVYAINEAGRQIDVRVGAVGAEKKVSAVAAGSPVYGLFPASSQTLAAGSALVAAYFWDGAGHYSRQNPAYSAIDCSA